MTPMGETSDWKTFAIVTSKTLITMLIVLFSLSWFIEFIKVLVVMNLLNKSLAPLFRFAAIEEAAVPFASVGLFLGISYGGGLLIQESREANVGPRQIFLACAFMGFAHSIIEDTLLVVAFGADFLSVFFGRLAFAMLAMSLIAKLLHKTSDSFFYKALFNKQHASGYSLKNQTTD